MKKHLKLSLLIVAVLLAVIFIFLIYKNFKVDFKQFFSPEISRELFEKTIRSHGYSSALLLVITGALFYMIPGLSNSVICIFIGVCYGPMIGILMNICANMLGNIGLYFTLKHVTLSERFKKATTFLDKIEHMKHPSIGLTLGYMIPFIPAIFVNFVSGRLPLKFPLVLSSMLIGTLPVATLYAFGGDALFKGNHKQALLLILAVLLLTIFILFFRKEDEKKKLSHS